MKGSALILALWVMTLLSLFVWAMGRRASREALLSGMAVEDLAFEALARETVLDAARLAAEKDDGGPTSASSPWAAAEGASEEEGRVNVNVLDLEGLARLFHGNKDAAATVMDWRDADDKTTPGGAESGDYEARGASPCRNAPLRFPEELLLVKGVTRELYDQASPVFTVWGDGRVNVNTASTRALEVLGLSPGDALAVTAFRTGLDGAAGTADDRIFSGPADATGALNDIPMTQDGKNIFSALLTHNRLSFRGSHLRHQKVIPLGETLSRSVTLVTAPRSEPGRVLLWREGP